MTPLERRITAALAAVFAMRMLGLFVVLPVFAIYGPHLEGATPLLIGLAIGAYGLVQGFLQIPFGVLSDRVGRKPMIFAGLLLFAVGGLVAAASDSIWGVIAGRALQGSGAVSGVVMALLADLTREAHRTRAMAVIGATVGLSFGLAMVLGPLIAAGTGLHGLFLFTSVMALASLALIFLFVPTPVAVVRDAPRRRMWPELWRVLRHQGLFRLDLGVFLLHLVMVAVFIVVPPSLIAYEQLPAERHWLVYLPVILVSLVFMAPLMMAAERSGRMREALVLSGVALVLSLLLLAFAHRSLPGVVIGLLLYFTAFNLLEALMPSMVGRLCPAGSRGAAMGVYSSGQFFGAFAGGLVGGGLSSVMAPEAVLLVCAVLMALWVLIAMGLRLRTRRRALVLPLPPGADPRQLAERLLAQEGVLEATVVPEDGVIHVTVDHVRCNESRLHAALG
ncbi:MAG: MFS transporter [Pseudomonadota bacterium]